MRNDCLTNHGENRRWLDIEPRQNLSHADRFVTLDDARLALTAIDRDAHGCGRSSQTYDRIAGGRAAAEIA